MLATEHQTAIPNSRLPVSGALLGARASYPFRKLGSVARRLQYAVVLLVCAGVVLSLYEMVGEYLLKDAPHPTGLVAFASASILTWLIALAPAAILMVLMGGVIPQRRFTRVIWLALGVVCSASAGAILADLLLEGGDVPWILANPRDVLADTLGFLLPAALLMTVYEFHRRSVETAEAAFRVHADRIGMESELSKARVRLLRAQIEPHFIFNSLAHVRRLYQVDSASGHEMLSGLVRYFASALPSLRRETCSLAEEAALIDAYLAIHHLRMGSRLTYEVVFPADLLTVQVPTMLLLTLVENSIKHGLSALLAGGFVRVSALVSGTALELRVADSGLGMTVNSGHGTGLANIRARLSSLYGSLASLTLSNNQPRGITAVVRLPLQAAIA